MEEIISNHKKDFNNADSKNQTLGSVGILATKATVRSDIYTDLYFRLGGKGSLDFHFVIAPDLVDMVELGINDNYKIKFVITKYLSQFPKDINTLVLGCTHFSVYKKYFDQLFTGTVIDPSFYSAQKFDKYLKSHLEIENKLSKNSTIKFYTTGATVSFDKIGFNICNKQIISRKINI